MTWVQLHAESETRAIEAKIALSAKDESRATNLYRQAAELEQKALDSLEPDKVRTRGITAVSAVALWYKANEYTAAERLAYGLLADDDIPDFARDQLRNLVQAIWTEHSKREAGVAFLPGQVSVSVKGGEVVTGGAPLDLIVDKVQSIQSIFYRTIEYLTGIAHRKHGPPSKDLQDACRPWLFQSTPGSYQFSVAIQKPMQADFFKAEVAPKRIAQHFLEIVSASAEENVEDLKSIVPNDEYRVTFLKLARNLAPTGKKFEKIEFRSAEDSRPISLDSESRTRINYNLQKSREVAQETATTEELKGTLRALHLDKDWLEVVSDGKTIHISGLQEAVDDVIGPMVNRQVIVQFIRTSLKKLKFVDIELDE